MICTQNSGASSFDIVDLKKHVDIHSDGNVMQQSSGIPKIVPLNVGGVRYITRLSTLCLHPESMLAAMFSGRHEIDKDQDGYFFLDANGKHFEHILEFLRHGTLPPKNVIEPVYRLAKYLAIKDLIQRLECSLVIAREIVQTFHRDLFPDYEGIRLKIIQIAMQKAACNDHIGCVRVLVAKSAAGHSQHPDGHPCNNPESIADMRVGPWDTKPSEYCLMNTLYSDISREGFNLTKGDPAKCDFIGRREHCPVTVHPFVFDFK